MSEIKSVHILNCLPECMLPDGGEACKGFINAAMRVDEQQASIWELEAENKVLREAAEDLAGDCERHVKTNCELLSENKRLRAFAKEIKRTYLLSPHIQLWANWALTGDSAKEPGSASTGVETVE